MKLLIDIGNSRTKWGVARVDGVAGPWTLSYGPGGIAAALEAVWYGQPPEAVIAASVTASEALSEVALWSRGSWGCELAVVRSLGACGGIVNAYPEPVALGADRWANLLGLRALTDGHAAVVADIGTAITVDGLTAGGRHVGGAILASAGAAGQGLRQAAPALAVPGAGTEIPAVSTAAAMGAGLTIGAAGAVDRVAGEVARALDDGPLFYLTGGGGADLHGHLAPHWHYDAGLTLRGLAAAWEAGCAGSL